MVTLENVETVNEFASLFRKDYDKMKATLALVSALEEGERSAREEGWLSAEEVEKSLGLK